MEEKQHPPILVYIVKKLITFPEFLKCMYEYFEENRSPTELERKYNIQEASIERFITYMKGKLKGVTDTTQRVRIIVKYAYICSEKENIEDYIHSIVEIGRQNDKSIYTCKLCNKIFEINEPIERLTVEEHFMKTHREIFETIVEKLRRCMLETLENKRNL